MEDRAVEIGVPRRVFFGDAAAVLSLDHCPLHEERRVPGLGLGLLGLFFSGSGAVLAGLRAVVVDARAAGLRRISIRRVLTAALPHAESRTRG